MVSHALLWPVVALASVSATLLMNAKASAWRRRSASWYALWRLRRLRRTKAWPPSASNSQQPAHFILFHGRGPKVRDDVQEVLRHATDLGAFLADVLPEQRMLKEQEYVYTFDSNAALTPDVLVNLADTPQVARTFAAVVADRVDTVVLSTCRCCCEVAMKRTATCLFQSIARVLRVQGRLLLPRTTDAFLLHLILNVSYVVRNGATYMFEVDAAYTGPEDRNGTFRFVCFRKVRVASPVTEARMVQVQELMSHKALRDRGVGLPPDG